MKHTFCRRLGWIVAVLAVGAGLAVSSGAAAEPVKVTVAPSGSGDAKTDWSARRTAAIAQALSGQFAEALASLREVATARPDDTIARQAVKVLSDYLRARKASDAQRDREYAEAVERVKHCRIAQDYVEKAPEDEMKALREHVRELAKAYNTSGMADDIEDAPDADAAEKLRTDSIASLEKTLAGLEKAAAAMKGRTDAYATAFLGVARCAEGLLRRHIDLWRGLKPADRADRRRCAAELKELEYTESEVLSDLESMTLEKPWRSGLLQARLAYRLAADKDAMARESWFTRLVAETEARGRKHVEKAEWYDAIAAFSSLKELLPDNEEYQRMVKVVQRHVRVLGMYGQEPAADAPEDEEPGWKEAVANVDVDMVEKVIGQVDMAYVSPVDYRKVARGALLSVRVLAETPQAAHSFPGLKDEAKRAEFVEAIDRLLEDAEKKDKYDHLDIILSLNAVLRASERTIDLPTEVLCVEFTDGLLSELDKFSSMIWPSEVVNFEKQTMGEFYGVGIQITKEDGEPLRVATPLVGTPAFRAGIKAGDLIIAVTNPPGKPRRTEKLSIDKLVDMIMGKKGTTVVLTIKRGGRTLEVPIVRDRIRIRTVKGWYREPRTGDWDYVVDPDSRIAYIRLTQFTAQTDDHLAAALAELRSHGVRSVVLDLRFNPGGLLRAAAMVANEFLSYGRIVSTRGRRVQAHELNANSIGKYLEGDLVVLVNQYSASAAEIVSGALKDWRRARIVGERTYGKGSVQNVIPIPRHNARLKLTTAYYYLPRGRLLHRKNGAKDWGVDPDVKVPLTPAQTRRWLDLRRKTDVILDDTDEQYVRRLLDRQYAADIQLNTAVVLLKLLQLQQRSAA